jgi:hypothetical protein
MKFKKGQSFRMHISALGEARKVHVVAVIENDMLVYKYFGKHKQWWHYFVDSRTNIEFYIKLAQTDKPKSSPTGNAYHR